MRAAALVALHPMAAVGTLRGEDVALTDIPGVPHVILCATGMKSLPDAAAAPLHAGAAAQAADGLSLRPWDGRQFHDYEWVKEPGAMFSFRVQVEKPQDATHAVVTIWDWLGRPVYVHEYRPLPVDAVLKVTAECHGIWLVTLDTYGAGKSGKGRLLRDRLVKSFGTPADASACRALWRDKNDYVLGSCFFPDRYLHGWHGWKFDAGLTPELSAADGVDRLVELAARAGFTILRCDSLARPNAKGRSRWDLLDAELDILQRHGIRADLKFYLWPTCFVGETLQLDETAFAAWDADLVHLIEHHLDRADSPVAMVELGNEPAHHEFWPGTREQYQWLYEHARKKILAANPTVAVTHGGTCPPGADLGGEKEKNPAIYEAKKKLQEDWYRAFYRDVGKKESLWSYHLHGALSDDAVAWRTWERDQLSRADFTGAFFQTEGGSCAWRPDREVVTWIEVVQKILHSWSMGERGWLQYDLAFTTEASRYADGKGWGMIDAHDFTPKFQYAAIAGMAKTMAGCSLDSVLLLDTSHAAPTLAAALNHPRGKLVAWYGDAEMRPLAVTSDATEMVFIDPMGNEAEMRPGGNASLAFEHQPRYLLLVGATRVARRSPGGKS